mgnify:CR=1 FL=1
MHRIGRTGRAGASGEAISLVCVDEEIFLRDIQRLIHRTSRARWSSGFGSPISNRARRAEDAPAADDRRLAAIRNGNGGGRPRARRAAAQRSCLTLRAPPIRCARHPRAARCLVHRRARERPQGPRPGARFAPALTAVIGNRAFTARCDAAADQAPTATQRGYAGPLPDAQVTAATRTCAGPQRCRCASGGKRKPVVAGYDALKSVANEPPRSTRRVWNHGAE